MADELEKANAERVVGPDAVRVSLTVNGAPAQLEVEPRTTLLDALRTQLGLTGAKEGCDRGSCGACTVLLDDDPVYACSMLAIEANGRSVTTIEGLAAAAGGLTELQRQLVAHDGLQCGYCTPGFVMTLTALLRRNPHPSEAEIREATAGNLCRCGSYPRIFAGTLAAAGTPSVSTLEVLHPDTHGLA